MNPFYWLADPAHAKAAFWVLVVSGVSYVATLALLGILVRRAARWLWRRVSVVAGSWVSFLAWQWSTRPVRRCICCRREDADAAEAARTRREVFGPLGEFGPYRMPRREPRHVPPQVLPSTQPWPCLDAESADDGFAWFGEPEDLVPLSLDALIEQCRVEHDREFGGAP